MPMRSGRLRRRNFPAWALDQLSREGVAEPRTHTASRAAARTTARSRAWYRGASDCLYEPSCSSSTTMAPRSLTGAKRADRAPTATVFSPAWSCRQASYRSPLESPEWSTATSSPKWARKRRTVWGVREISGTSTIAPRPRARTRFRSSMYTRVFPEPVTPWRRKGRGKGSPIAAVSAATASSWAGVRGGSGPGSTGMDSKGSRTSSRSSTRTSPFSSRPAITDREKPPLSITSPSSPAPPAASRYS